MGPAETVRNHKETWPELYCPNRDCLWRIVVSGRPDNPCPKHTKQVLPGLRITEV
jgi:hypothetical protein